MNIRANNSRYHTESLTRIYWMFMKAARYHIYLTFMHVFSHLNPQRPLLGEHGEQCLSNVGAMLEQCQTHAILTPIQQNPDATPIPIPYRAQFEQGKSSLCHCILPLLTSGVVLRGRWWQWHVPERDAPCSTCPYRMVSCHQNPPRNIHMYCYTCHDQEKEGKWNVKPKQHCPFDITANCRVAN